MRRLMSLLAVLVVVPAGVAVAQDPAPRAPDASTRDATAIGSTSATVQGVVVPNGAPTRYRFEYGPTSALGSVTPDGPAGDTSARTVAATLTGLQPASRVFYRVVASSAYGENRGGIRSFFTNRLVTALTLGLRPEPAGFGGAFRAAGRLQGAGVAGTRVALEAYAQNRWRQIGQTVQADAAGDFAFSITPVLVPLRMRAMARTNPPVSSPVRDLRVRPRVGMTARRGAPRRRVFSGTVRPALEGARISLQRRAANGKWVLVKRGPTARARRTQKFSIDVPARRGVYRVVSVSSLPGWSRGVSRERAVAGVD